MNHPVKCTLAAVGVAAMTLALPGCDAAAQSPEPRPAFAGQTDAAPPAKPSPPLKVETLATGLRGAWSLAFLPDGRFLVTQGGVLMVSLLFVLLNLTVDVLHGVVDPRIRRAH